MSHSSTQSVKNSMTTPQLSPSQAPLRRTSVDTPSATSTQELTAAKRTQSPMPTTTVISDGPSSTVSTSCPTTEPTSHPLRNMATPDSLTSSQLTTSALRTALAARTMTITLLTRKTTPNSETSTQT